jgi:YD repeat-containing protein
MTARLGILVACATFYISSAIAASGDPVAVADPKNGNLSIRIIDANSESSGYDLRVVRIFNSTAKYIGMFGNGFCSDYETRLFELPEGNVAIVECGAGQALLYGSLGALDKRVVDAVATWKRELSISAQEATNLLVDFSTRIDFAKRRNLPAKDAAGIRLYSNGRGPGYLNKKDGGYTLTEPNGSFVEYGAEGHILAMTDGNGNSLTFRYTTGRLTAVTSNSGQRVEFFYNDQGFVREAKGSWGSVFYEYDREGRILKVERGNATQKYTYSNSGSLAGIVHSNDWKARFNLVGGKVDEIQVSDGCTDSFVYPSESANGTYKVIQNRACPAGAEQSSRTVYEYWVELNESATRRILKHSTVTSIDKIVRVTYHPVFQQPTEVVVNNATTTYSYNSKGLVSRVLTKGRENIFEYDSNCQKPSSSTTMFRGSSAASPAKISKFFYDDKCNLSVAETPDHKINLKYDRKGRIAIANDSVRGKTILISYDEKFGKPSLVEALSVGKLHISYNPDGSIGKVDSPEGPSVSMQVASTFNNLLDAVAPATNDAGVSEHSQLGQNCRCAKESFLFDDIKSGPPTVRP